MTDPFRKILNQEHNDLNSILPRVNGPARNSQNFKNRVRTVYAEDPALHMVYGSTIWDNPIPVETVYAEDAFVKLPDKRGVSFALTETMLSKHLLLLGGIGSGKTNVFNFILKDMIAHQSNSDLIFVFDTKGDYYERFARFCDQAIVIGNSEQYRQNTRYWNVFQELNNDEFAVKEIAKQLFEGRGSTTQPFFHLAAADLTAKVMTHFMRINRRTGGQPPSEYLLNNHALVNWFRSASVQKYNQMIDMNPDFASAKLYFGDPGQGAGQKLTPQALGVFGYINAMIDDLFDPNSIFAMSQPGREFAMTQLVRNRGAGGRKTVVFIEYDLKAGEVLSPMYRILIDLALKEALSQSRRRDGNVYFLIDEFKLLPKLLHIDDALNFGRSLGVRVIAGLQSIDQLYANYEESRGKTIAAGFMSSFCFSTPDASSRRYIAERFGENYGQLVIHANGQPVSTPKAGHTVEDWDVLNFPVGMAAVDLVGEKPFLFDFAEFNSCNGR